MESTATSNKPRVAFLEEGVISQGGGEGTPGTTTAATTEVTYLGSKSASWTSTNSNSGNSTNNEKTIHRSVSDLPDKIPVGSGEKYVADDLSSLVSSEDDRNSTVSGSEAGTSATGASSTGTWAGTGMRTTALDRVPMMYYMLLLLAIPVIIIIATQATVMAKAQHAIDFFQDHEGIVSEVLDCSESIVHEWEYTTEYLEHNSTYANASIIAYYTEKLQHAQEATHHHCDELHDAAFNSKLPAAEAARIRHALLDLSFLRSQILSRATDVTSAREGMWKVISDVSRVLTALKHEPALEAISVKIEQLYFARTWENAIGMCEGVGASILLAKERGVPVGVRVRNEMQSCWTASELSATMFHAVADSDGQEYFHIIESDAHSKRWHDIADLMVHNEEHHVNVSVTEWEELVESALEDMAEQDHHLIEKLHKATALHQQVAGAAGAMVGYIIACALATAFVIVMQLRFQKRMDISLNRSRELNRGVQKFVPRNQLKMMGVRSITEVESGDFVEVASTMLFSDIRDFTTISEKMGRGELFNWLQSYFASMTRVVEDNRGYVEKFIGDALFCVFSNPSNAVKCGTAMQRAVEQLNAQLNSEGREDLVHIGVGIHHGIVAAGVFGDEGRLACTLVSSDVNLASRLEGVTKAYGAKIIVSEAVYERIDTNAFLCRFLGELQVKGSESSVKIYEVFQNDEPSVKALKLSTKGEFEAALRMRDESPGEAYNTMLNLAQAVAEQKDTRPRDPALNMKLKQWKNATRVVDRLGKHGSLLSPDIRQPPPLPELVAMDASASASSFASTAPSLSVLLRDSPRSGQAHGAFATPNAADTAPLSMALETPLQASS